MPKFLGFPPDADSTTPGAGLDCVMMVPSLRGMRAAPSLVRFGVRALPSKALGAATLKKLDNTQRLVAGVTTNLYEEVAGAWSNVTRASGPYTTSSSGVWRFAQFGNETIATNNADVLQQSQTGAFADIGSGIYTINVTAGGTGYTSAPVVTITGGGGAGATAEAFLTGSAVTSIEVTNAGSGFTSAPTISFSGGGGSGATAPPVMQPPPVASIIETVAGFVFAFNTVDPNYGEPPDGRGARGG